MLPPLAQNQAFAKPYLQIKNGNALLGLLTWFVKERPPTAYGYLEIDY
jgi:hypothetical protein